MVESATVDTNILLFAKAVNEHKLYAQLPISRTKIASKNLSVFVHKAGWSCELFELLTLG